MEKLIIWMVLMNQMAMETQNNNSYLIMNAHSEDNIFNGMIVTIQDDIILGSWTSNDILSILEGYYIHQKKYFNNKKFPEYFNKIKKISSKILKSNVLEKFSSKINHQIFEGYKCSLNPLNNFKNTMDFHGDTMGFDIIEQNIGIFAKKFPVKFNFQPWDLENFPYFIILKKKNIYIFFKGSENPHNFHIIRFYFKGHDSYFKLKKMLLDQKATMDNISNFIERTPTPTPENHLVEDSFNWNKVTYVKDYGELLKDNDILLSFKPLSNKPKTTLDTFIKIIKISMGIPIFLLIINFVYGLFLNNHYFNG
jgi:hypothetical protein